MKNSNFEDLAEFLGEHKLTLAMVVLGIFAGANFLMGGGDRLTQKMNRDARTEELKELQTQTASAQAAAEKIFYEQGATAQVLSRKTRTTNLISGETVIDPASITRQNLDGTIINGGFVVSRDGSIFSVDQNGIITLVGTSPKIRNTIVRNGMAQGAEAMQRAAARYTGFLVNRP